MTDCVEIRASAIHQSSPKLTPGGCPLTVVVYTPARPTSVSVIFNHDMANSWPGGALQNTSRKLGTHVANTELLHTKSKHVSQAELLRGVIRSHTRVGGMDKTI